MSQITTQEPLVTIGITCFNAEDSIGRAIDSALSQDYANIEIIIVDDCSSDRSLDVIKRKTDGLSNVTIIKNEVNKGAAASFNIIADAARGEYVSLFDDDDYSLPIRISESMRVLAGDDRKVFFCDRFINKAEEGLTFGVRPLAVTSTQLAKYMADALFYHLDKKFCKNNPEFFESVKGHGVKGSVGSGIMTCPTEIIRKVRFNEELRRFYDTEFNLRVASAGYSAVGSEKPCMIQTLTDSEDKGVPYSQLSILEALRTNEKIINSFRIDHPLDFRTESLCVAADDRIKERTTVRATIGLLTYNCIDTIGYSLNSALSQVGGEYEILILDDCSTDGTFEFLQKFSSKDARVRLLRNEQNRGAGYSRKVVVDEAKGEFLVFFDDDDVSKNTRVIEQVAQIEKSESDSICIARFNHFANSKYLGPRNPFGLYGDLIYPDLGNRIVWNEVLRHTAQRHLMPQTGVDGTFHYALGTSLMAGHISVFRRFQFDENLRRMQDLEFLLRFTSEGGKLIQSNNILINVISTESVDKSWNIIFANSSYILSKHKSHLMERFNIDSNYIINANSDAYDSEIKHHEKVKDELSKLHNRIFSFAAKTKRILRF